MKNLFWIKSKSPDGSRHNDRPTIDVSKADGPSKRKKRSNVTSPSITRHHPAPDLQGLLSTAQNIEGKNSSVMTMQVEKIQRCSSLPPLEDEMGRRMGFIGRLMRKSVSWPETNFPAPQAKRSWWSLTSTKTSTETLSRTQSAAAADDSRRLLYLANMSVEASGGPARSDSFTSNFHRASSGNSAASTSSCASADTKSKFSYTSPPALPTPTFQRKAAWKLMGRRFSQAKAREEPSRPPPLDEWTGLLGDGGVGPPRDPIRPQPVQEGRDRKQVEDRSPLRPEAGPPRNGPAFLPSAHAHVRAPPCDTTSQRQDDRKQEDARPEAGSPPEASRGGPRHSEQRLDDRKTDRAHVEEDNRARPGVEGRQDKRKEDGRLQEGDGSPIRPRDGYAMLFTRANERKGGQTSSGSHKAVERRDEEEERVRRRTQMEKSFERGEFRWTRTLA